MKLLLDENLPHRLRHFLPGHEVFTVAFMGWAGLKNGQLLTTAAAAGFDVLLTIDDGIGYQTNFLTLPMPVLVLQAQSNAFEDVLPLVTSILKELLDIGEPCVRRLPALKS